MYLLVLDQRYQVDGEDVEFTKLIKRGNELICHQTNGDIFTIGGAKWENLSVEDGSFTTEVSNPDVLVNNVADLKIEDAKADILIHQVMREIAQIKIKLMKGGL